MSSWYRSGACSNEPPRSLTSRRVRPFSGGLAVVSTLALVVLPPLAWAQQGAFGARKITLDLTQRLEWNDNPDFSAAGDSAQVFTTTDLAFALERRTGVAFFRFDLSGNFEIGRDDIDGDGFENPSLGLRYDRDVGHSRIGASLRFRETDVSSLVPETDPLLDPGFAELDTGTRQDTAYEVNGAFGIDAPLGASYRLARTSLRYSGTSDPDLRDQDTDTAEGQIEFRIDPRMTGRLFTRYVQTDVDGGVDRDTTIFGAGLRLDVNPRLVADISLSRDRVELSGTTSRVEEGFGVSLGLTQEMPNGTLGATLSSRVEENGRREQFRLNRAFDLPRGAIALSFGLTQTEGFDLSPLYGIDWRQDMPRASFNVSLTQSVATGSDVEELINTSLSFGYSRELTSVSSLSASAALRRRDELGAAGADSERLDLRVTYRRELERDWGIEGGVSHIRSTSDTEADRTQNRIFIGLSKRFAWN